MWVGAAASVANCATLACCPPWIASRKAEWRLVVPATPRRMQAAGLLLLLLPLLSNPPARSSGAPAPPIPRGNTAGSARPGHGTAVLVRAAPARNAARRKPGAGAAQPTMNEQRDAAWGGPNLEMQQCLLGFPAPAAKYSATDQSQKSADHSAPLKPTCAHLQIQQQEACIEVGPAHVPPKSNQAAVAAGVPKVAHRRQRLACEAIECHQWSQRKGRPNAGGGYTAAHTCTRTVASGCAPCTAAIAPRKSTCHSGAKFSSATMSQSMYSTRSRAGAWCS